MNDEQEGQAQNSEAYGPKREGMGELDRANREAAAADPPRQLTVEILLDKNGVFVQRCLLRDDESGEIVGQLPATEANWEMAAGAVVACNLKVLGKWAKIAYSAEVGLMREHSLSGGTGYKQPAVEVKGT